MLKKCLWLCLILSLIFIGNTFAQEQVSSQPEEKESFQHTQAPCPESPAWQQEWPVPLVSWDHHAYYSLPSSRVVKEADAPARCRLHEILHQEPKTCNHQA